MIWPEKKSVRRYLFALIPEDTLANSPIRSWYDEIKTSSLTLPKYQKYNSNNNWWVDWYCTGHTVPQRQSTMLANATWNRKYECQWSCFSLGKRGGLCEFGIRDKADAVTIHHAANMALPFVSFKSCIVHTINLGAQKVYTILGQQWFGMPLFGLKDHPLSRLFQEKQRVLGKKAKPLCKPQSF